MARYIDADALMEMLNKKAQTDLEMGLYNHGTLTQSFIRFVERQPTADVAPRAEVAREIFEEIKDQLRGIFDFFRQDNDIRESCAIMFAISEVDKIEKKYTQPEPPKGD